MADPTSHYLRPKVTKVAVPRSTGAARLSDTSPAKWNCPDGVSKVPRFWDLLNSPELWNALRAALGSKEITYLEHSDLKVWRQQPSTGWHRDSRSAIFGTGSEWEEKEERYVIARVAIYLQPSSEGF